MFHYCLFLDKVFFNIKFPLNLSKTLGCVDKFFVTVNQFILSFFLFFFTEKTFFFKIKIC